MRPPSCAGTHGCVYTLSKDKEQEYYYADYIRRIGKISDAQYFHGLELSKQAIKNKEKLVYHPELHDQELFDQMMKEKAEKEATAEQTEETKAE